MAQYILSIDQGTTSSRAILMDAKGQILAQGSEEFPQYYPKPGWVGHDANEIWESVEISIEKCLKEAGINPVEIVGIGITNQRETALMWDAQTGEPVDHAIVWQCRRTSDQCEKLKKNKKGPAIKNATGLIIDPYFSSTKFRWLLDNSKKAKALLKTGTLRAGNIDAYLIWKLTAGQSFKTDVTNASRTQLMNIKKLKWDPKMLELFNIKESILPEIVPSSSEFGVTKGVHSLPDGIPILGVAGDQQAALFGQTCFSLGEAKCTFGTGSFMLLNTGQELVRSKKGLVSTLAWQIEGEKPVYALEGSVFICGAAVQWLRDGLGIIQSSAEVEALANEVKDSAGVEFVPALTGLGAPHWLPEARGIITGITRGTTKAHIAHATLEAMALQNADLLEAMQSDLGKKIKVLKVDGGAAANNTLMQMQSNYIGVKTHRPQFVETTAIGAAYLAGLKAGVWKSQKQIREIWKLDQEFTPVLKPNQRKDRLTRWHQAIALQK